MSRITALLYGSRERYAAADIDTTMAFVHSLPRVLGVSALVTACAFGGSFLVPKTYTAATSLIPPQQQQSAASMALQNLGALAGLAGAATGIKSPVDQYVALLESRNARLEIVRKFDLKSVYGEELDTDALRELGKRTRVAVGRKDGLIFIEVDDEDPQRAASIAAAYIGQLERLTTQFALTESQQRRQFFERQTEDARGKLAVAQQALQASGFNEAVIRSEPKAAAEAYAKLSAELTSTEVRLQGLRRLLAEQAPEIQRLQAQLATLRAKLAALESANQQTSGTDYVGRYREYKYQETLLELFTKQLELAKVDESREGPSVQVVDVATVPERHSKPRHVFVAAVAGLLTAGLLLLGLLALRGPVRSG